MKKNNIRIDSGEIRLTINDDPSRVISFNPSDVVFAEQVYALMVRFEEKSEEFLKRSAELDELGDEEIIREDAGNVTASLKLLRDACEFMRKELDKVFGEGTSQTAFGDVLNLDMFVQFLDGITPFISDARQNKIKKYQVPQMKTKPKSKR